jgi:His/Glu/Gln/Arg/opine family amino acid ABC transporter permease subunit
MLAYFSDLAAWSPLILKGMITTVAVSIVCMILGSALGLIVALLRLVHYPKPLQVIQFVLYGYVEVFRGLPIIVTLFIVYFGLPSIGLSISADPIIAGIFALSLTLGAYLSEVFRAAILSVDLGQMEAARSVGMSKRQALQRIVVPQALLVAVPTLGGYFISLLKDTSLLGFISVFDLMRAGVIIVSTTFQPFEIYLTIGAIYLALSLISSWIASRLERSLRPVNQMHEETDVRNLNADAESFEKMPQPSENR